VHRRARVRLRWPACASRGGAASAGGCAEGALIFFGQPKALNVPAIQYWFTGGAVAVFLALLGAVSTLGYAWYRAAVTEMESASSKAALAAQKLKADRVKGLLAKALVSGDTLIRSHKDTNEDQAQKDAEKWGQQTHDLIAAAYGEGEAALFLDDSGYVFYSVPLPMNTIRNWIDGRMRRLTELLKRSDTLSTRTDFDPAKFE
jgi:hypothetical protein